MLLYEEIIGWRRGTRKSSAIRDREHGAASAIRPGLHLGNFLRRLGLPKAIKDWPLRILQVKLLTPGS
jgi:hypothetical protein